MKQSLPTKHLLLTELLPTWQCQVLHARFSRPLLRMPVKSSNFEGNGRDMNGIQRHIDGAEDITESRWRWDSLFWGPITVCLVPWAWQMRGMNISVLIMICLEHDRQILIAPRHPWMIPHACQRCGRTVSNTGLFMRTILCVLRCPAVSCNGLSWVCMGG
jgi:hypothetical protein